MAQQNPLLFLFPGSNSAGNGVKLASPTLVKQMWHEGRSQFLPFVATAVAIVLTDLLTGILIGLATAVRFVLHSTMRHPMRRIVEKHPGGEILHIELTNQVSFLNRAALAQALSETPANGHVLIDAHNTDYIDPDVLDLIRDFKELSAPAAISRSAWSGLRPNTSSRTRFNTLTIRLVSFSNHSPPDRSFKS